MVSLLLLLAVPVSAQPAYAPEAVGAESPSAEPARPSQGARIATELGVGMLASMGLGLAGGLAGGIIGFATCSEGTGGYMDFSGLCPLGAAAIGYAAGAGVGLPLGVWWGGNKLGGNGSLAATFAGLGASVGLIALAERTHQSTLVSAAVLTLPVLTIVGYELSDTEPTGAVPTTVTPAVGLGAGGSATFGLQGSF